MRENISTLEVRARLGDLLNRVDLRHDEFVIQRRGRTLAALVPASRLEAMEQAARAYGLTILNRPRRAPLSETEAYAVAEEAIRSVRNRRRKR
jgi:prevent-host-death family protein